MPDKKSCTSKCYCTKNAVSCQHTKATRGKTVFGQRSLVEKSASISSSQSQLEFVKIKREYDALSTASQGSLNFSRRSSTSSVDSLATPSSASTSNCSSNSCCQRQKKQNSNSSDRVNKLKYSDQRTLYEQLRLASEEPGYLTKTTEQEEAARPTKIYLFDAAYLKALQEFRLSNRSECFGK